MALLKYFKRDDSKAVLPNPEGPLSSSMRSRECNDTRVSVGMFARSLADAELRLLNPREKAWVPEARSRVDTQPTPHFALSPFCLS